MGSVASTGSRHVDAHVHALRIELHARHHAAAVVDRDEIHVLVHVQTARVDGDARDHALDGRDAGAGAADETVVGSHLWRPDAEALGHLSPIDGNGHASG